MNNAEKGIQILQLTNDGNDLSPNQLSLLELAINNHLSELGQQAFNDLYQNILANDYQKWFHDNVNESFIEYLDFAIQDLENAVEAIE